MFVDVIPFPPSFSSFSFSYFVYKNGYYIVDYQLMPFMSLSINRAINRLYYL
jgi:hypothetical protein